MLLLATKNILGVALVAAELVLLFLPGQGLITILFGLMIMNYPGKFLLERWLVKRPGVLPTINWIRKKYDRDPLVVPA